MGQITPKTGTKYQHSDSYFESVIRILLDGRSTGLTNRALAATLNENGLTSHSGLPWNEERVKQTKKHLRNKQYAGSFYRALLRLIGSGAFTVKEATVLFLPRVKTA
ncbi:hypothetical protein GN109_15140 [Collimonas pratensis]|uniref:hypothetical protein n=1 Tax=Collimonas pratensis TaxID=279113 RepID=UPI00143D25C1|nr:hypothetical protein [Collimonas pratensis]NKI70757.1 hypothetical protein [Collimonas pratensis]